MYLIILVDILANIIRYNVCFFIYFCLLYLFFVFSEVKNFRINDKNKTEVLYQSSQSK